MINFKKNQINMETNRNIKDGFIGKNTPLIWYVLIQTKAATKQAKIGPKNLLIEKNKTAIDAIFRRRLKTNTES